MVEHLLHDYQHWMFMMWGGTFLLAVTIASAAYAIWTKRVQRQQATRITELLNVNDLASSLSPDRIGQSHGRSVDTLFILPDISNYTRFVTNTRLSPEETQDIIFALMGAIIKSVEKTLQFSKMEGDAALFFTDAQEKNAERTAKVILGIFEAFDRQRYKLLKSKKYDTTTTSLINDLDVKIIVHRGIAQRFSYRGTVDHFGSEVTLTHRLLKNHIGDSRYVLVTEPATDVVQFDDTFHRELITEKLEHIGSVRGTVFRPPQLSSTTASSTSLISSAKSGRPKADRLEWTSALEGRLNGNALTTP